MASAVPAAAIEARLRANWSDSDIHVGDAYDDLPQPPRTMVILEFVGGVAEQVTIGAPGNNLFREHGAFLLHVFVKAGEHQAKVAREICDTLAAIYRGKSFNRVDCWAPYPPQEDTAPNGNYYGMSFSTPYQFDLHA